ncbi:MAG: hypothetical protein ACYDIC_10860 [Desulfobaccales bacterium]
MQFIIRIPQKSFLAAVIALLLFSAAALAQSSSPDVALVTKLSGEATYRNEQEKTPVKVQAFMKVRQGDYLQMAGEGELQLLYFASGRQETWKGPARLQAGDGASVTPPGGQVTPEVKLLPASAAKKMAAAPFLLARGGASLAEATMAKGLASERAGATPMMEQAPPGRSGVTEMQRVSPSRSGAIQTMAPTCPVQPQAAPLTPAARKEIQAAKTVYQDLKKKAATGDFTPELYFLGVLAQHRQYQEMDQMLDKILQKNPGDQGFNDLKTWVRAQCN